MNKWILVTDKLPQAGKAVLCYCNHQNVFHEQIKWEQIDIGAKNSYDDNFTLRNDDTTFVNVTNWMPLPKEPNKQKP